MKTMAVLNTLAFLLFSANLRSEEPRFNSTGTGSIDKHHEKFLNDVVKKKKDQKLDTEFKADKKREKPKFASDEENKNFKVNKNYSDYDGIVDTGEQWKERMSVVDKILQKELGKPAEYFKKSVSPWKVAAFPEPVPWSYGQHQIMRGRLEAAQKSFETAVIVFNKHASESYRIQNGSGSSSTGGISEKTLEKVSQYLLEVIQDRTTIETIAVAASALSSVSCHNTEQNIEHYEQSIAHTLFRSASAMYLSLMLIRVSNFNKELADLTTQAGKSIGNVDSSKFMDLKIQVHGEKIVFEEAVVQSREYFLDLMTWVQLIALEEKNERNFRSAVANQKKKKIKKKYERLKAAKAVGARSAYVSYSNARKELSRSRLFAGMHCSLVGEVKNSDSSYQRSKENLKKRNPAAAKK